MKKFLIIILVITLVLLTACGGGDSKPKEEPEPAEPSKFIGTWITIAYIDEDGTMAFERGYDDVIKIVFEEDGDYIFDPVDPIEGVWVDEGDKLVMDKGTPDEEAYEYIDGLLKFEMTDGYGYLALEGSSVGETEKKLYEEAYLLYHPDGTFTER
ncbi:MAG: hypothetical protein GXY89_07870 [Tissierellia bacterium]|jgi:hypothetical protein|nr:hypothetical protein [Tissierellia bacterium]